MNAMDSNTGEHGGSDQMRATPVMSQYLELKRAHPDCLLFYRMGDFYELFFADAEAAARTLGIALTKRGKHLGEDIPMCGVPVHAADGYLQRLIRHGHRVAVCEQMEDPAEARKRGSKSVLRRGVVRLVTPGTLTEDSLLDARAHNYLAALVRLRGSGDVAIAWADISSGDVSVQLSGPARLAADLARIGPSEIVVPDSLPGEEPFTTILGQLAAPLTPLPAVRFDSQSAERRLCAFYNIAAVEAFGEFSRCEIACLGGLIEYISLTQAGRAPHLRPPRRAQADGFLLIDAATRANLELSRTLGGERSGSLLSAIDMTVTASGARLLAERLAMPLADPPQIRGRQDEISLFLDSGGLRDGLRRQLAKVPDLERALARLTLGRGGPRDLAALRDGLLAANSIAIVLTAGEGLGGLPLNVVTAASALVAVDADLSSELSAVLADDLPLLARDGGFVRAGYSPDLDHNRVLRDETRQVIAGLQASYAEATGVKTLKIRHNNVLGYFIEVAVQHAPAVQHERHAGRFIHRQTVASAMRFVTTELSGLEHKIAAAADRALVLETGIFERLAQRVADQRPAIAACAAALAALDVASALAELAWRNRLVRPIVDTSTAFDIVAGRHPVVEAMLQAHAAGTFVANDCRLPGDGQRLWLLTGPNMAGKSTFLRQNAVIVILAQMGSFVPADRAHIGMVDRLFSRVGAADDLARGRSTFMVEMVETAAILNQATQRSFVILDEIGRGTATFDGLSIAWATIEHLHDVNRCRALFATHYHELTALAVRLSHLANATVKVREWQGDVVFLHEVVSGVADRSYGIQVARLAGLPAAVISRAGDVLERLERGNDQQARKALVDDLPLFSARPAQPRPSSHDSTVEKALAAAVPDELTPRQALSLIYELKSLLPDRPSS